jgi:hypothetical protein
MMDPLSNLA